MSHAYAVFNGHLVNFNVINGGYSITLVEPAHNHLQKERVYHRVAVFGKVAQALRPKFKKGARFEFKCSIGYAKKNGNYYTNFNVKTWKLIPKPAQEQRPEPKPYDDDYFVPEINHTTTQYDRRHESYSPDPYIGYSRDDAQTQSPKITARKNTSHTKRARRPLRATAS